MSIQILIKRKLDEPNICRSTVQKKIKNRTIGQKFIYLNEHNIVEKIKHKKYK